MNDAMNTAQQAPTLTLTADVQRFTVTGDLLHGTGLIIDWTNRTLALEMPPVADDPVVESGPAFNAEDIDIAAGGPEGDTESVLPPRG